jgi:hypothetical protein
MIRTDNLRVDRAYKYHKVTKSKIKDLYCSNEHSVIVTNYCSILLHKVVQYKYDCRKLKSNAYKLQLVITNLYNKRYRFKCNTAIIRQNK